MLRVKREILLNSVRGRKTRQWQRKRKPIFREKLLGNNDMNRTLEIDERKFDKRKTHAKS